VSSWRRYYAYLSGVHPTLPRAELYALLETLGIEYRVVLELDQLEVFDANSDPSLVPLLAGYVHEIGLLHAIVDADPEAIRLAVERIPICSLVSDSFRVDVVKVKGYRSAISSRELAVSIGEAVARKCRARVDLEQPSTIVRVLVTEGIAAVGTVLSREDKSGLNQRRPERRPFFRSVALEPRLCRLFVNLSRPAPPVLDPFCGTGGFVLEVAEYGLTALCSDVDRAMVEGALRNVKFYGLDHAIDVFQADARLAPIRSGALLSIGTDPPYGRQAPSRGAEPRELLVAFLAEARRILKPGGYVSFAAPHWLNVDQLVARVGLELAEKHFMKVHGGLTRVLCVARRV
jgi:tRNA (guanine10-N2)-dimethyltransferase